MSKYVLNIGNSVEKNVRVTFNTDTMMRDLQSDYFNKMGKPNKLNYQMLI